MKNKMKNILNKKTAIIVGIISFFGVLIPNISWAVLSGKGIANAILKLIVNLVLFLVSQLVNLAAKFFELMMDLGFNRSYQSVAEVGWHVTRDISNMFFILFMIIVAFATILKIENYGIKKLLPKIIGIALLINFSLVICYFVVDITNITANFFIKDAKDTAIQMGNGKGSISAVFADGLNLTKVLNPGECADSLKERKKECKEAFGKTSEEEEECLRIAEKEDARCKEIKKDLKSATTQDQTTLDILMSGILGSAILGIAAFTLFAGGILLVIRILFIWILIMVAPFAFVSNIMPALKQNIWGKWIKSFFQWCFFAPAYAFFIWLAVKVVAARKLQQMSLLYEAAATGDPSFINAFFTTTSNLLHFLFVTGLLLGGLIAAKQFGITGANTAITLGKKWGKGTSKWISGRTTRYPKELGASAGASTMQGTGKFLKKIPGFGRIGRSLETRGTALRRKPEESEQLKAYDKTLDYKSEANLLEDGKKLAGVMGLKNFKKAFDKNILQKTDDREAVKSAVRAFESFGMLKEANELKQKRFDVIEKEEDRDKAYVGSKSKGELNQFRSEAFRNKKDKNNKTIDDSGTKALRTVLKHEVTVTDALEAFNKMRADAKNQIEKTLKEMIEDGTADEKEKGVYAGMSAKPHVAFKNDPNGLKQFVKDMQPADFGKLDKEAIPSVAEHVDASMALEMAKHLSTNKKDMFFVSFGASVQEAIKGKKGWEGRGTQKTKIEKQTQAPEEQEKQTNTVDLSGKIPGRGPYEKKNREK